eukprot:13581056-Alexandrium_andersonii.AAC.1
MPSSVGSGGDGMTAGGGSGAGGAAPWTGRPTGAPGCNQASARAMPSATGPGARGRGTSSSGCRAPGRGTAGAET